MVSWKVQLPQGISLHNSARMCFSLQSLIEKETQAVGVKMTRLVVDFLYVCGHLHLSWGCVQIHWRKYSVRPEKVKNTGLTQQRFSILDVVRQNKYNLLKILVKLQVGLKQRELNLALLHAVKAGTFVVCASLTWTIHLDNWLFWIRIYCFYRQLKQTYFWVCLLFSCRIPRMRGSFVGKWCWCQLCRLKQQLTSNHCLWHWLRKVIQWIQIWLSVFLSWFFANWHQPKFSTETWGCFWSTAVTRTEETPVDLRLFTTPANGGGNFWCFLLKLEKFSSARKCWYPNLKWLKLVLHLLWSLPFEVWPLCRVTAGLRCRERQAGRTVEFTAHVGVLPCLSCREDHASAHQCRVWCQYCRSDDGAKKGHPISLCRPTAQYDWRKKREIFLGSSVFEMKEMATRGWHKFWATKNWGSRE